MTVKLPAEFVVLNRPVSPVDVFPVEEGRLVALVGKELVLKSLIGHLLVLLADFHLLRVPDFGSADVLAASVVIQQGRCCRSIVTLGVEGLYLFKSFVVKIQ